MTAVLSDLGIRESRNDMLTMSVIVGTNSAMHSFRSQVGNGSSSHDFAGDSLIIFRISISVASSLLYTSGYVARNAMNNTASTECKDLFENKQNTMDLQVEQQHLKYTKNRDRGGLIYPSNSLSEVMQVAYIIFNMCVASDLQRKFINVHNQRHTLIGIIEVTTIVSEYTIPETTYLT